MFLGAGQGQVTSPSSPKILHVVTQQLLKKIFDARKLFRTKYFSVKSFPLCKILVLWCFNFSAKYMWYPTTNLSFAGEQFHWCTHKPHVFMDGVWKKTNNNCCIGGYNVYWEVCQDSCPGRRHMNENSARHSTPHKDPVSVSSSSSLLF